ncbi:SusD/RagB family nutrient-binding outer membrane lipoprotein [Sphingobacterium sp. Mn56C]|uniref:SusD/RagB family nutrient-binding outer membrane lipoprotein n=1 Tax=Sphingobacterium sp. Mn56C TaxID=3395261 RepID=UPI003BCB134C
MRTILTKSFAILSLASVFMAGCTKDTFRDINTDPNRPGFVTTTSILVSAERQLVNAIRSEDINLRGAQLFAQYFSQNIYTDQSRYVVQTAYSDTYWSAMYKGLNNLNEIIKLNTDPTTKGSVSLAGAGTNANQIAIARILKAYAFHNLTDVFGDIPYESYGNKDPDFEALQQAPDNLTPKYAAQEKIYRDILKELQESADTLLKYKDLNTFAAADIIYGGANRQWAKFANSLRLRLAMRIRSKDGSFATAQIEDALQKGVFASNADNAAFTFNEAPPYQAPLFRATVTANRKDFAVSKVLVDALQGKKGPFTALDPRLPQYAKANVKGAYVGQPYGLPLAAGNAFPIDSISLPGTVINAANYAEVLQEYAEVAFLIAEYKNWDTQAYKNGVKASLEKWKVAAGDVEEYLKTLPEANKETVLTQKYFALYNQGFEAWSEIRRTGYPLFLVKKGEVIWTGIVAGKPTTYTFNPEVSDKLPTRFIYPQIEQSTNQANYRKALAAQGDDVITTKVWWNR